MTPELGQPNQDVCGTCATFKEKKKNPEYICTWNCCQVKPGDLCICSPSHYRPRPDPISTPAPATCGKLGNHGFCPTSCELMTQIRNEEGILLFNTCYHLIKHYQSAIREQWEKEHTPEFHSENPDKFSPWYNVEMVAARMKSAYLQGCRDERERVINAVLNPENIVIDSEETAWVSIQVSTIESLRDSSSASTTTDNRTGEVNKCL